MSATCPGSITGLRNRALILIGFGGAFRRSELVALDVRHIRETEEGLQVFIPRSKTDQEAEGATIAIPRGATEACPVKALRDWLDAAGIERGPIFRPVNKAGAVSSDRLTSQSVALIVKSHAVAAGLDQRQFAGHSLRAGFPDVCGTCWQVHLQEMDQSRHASVDTLRGYIRDAELFKDHAGAGLLWYRASKLGSQTEFYQLPGCEPMTGAQIRELLQATDGKTRGLANAQLPVSETA